LKRFLGFARNEGVGLINSIGKCRISKKVKAFLNISLLLRRHDETISFADSSIEIASADEKSDSQ